MISNVEHLFMCLLAIVLSYLKESEIAQSCRTLCDPIDIFFLTAPVNERETLLRPQGHGAWARGHPAVKGEAGRGAIFNLLLGVQLVALASLLAAVDSTGGQASITLAADHLVTAVFLSKLAEGRLSDAASQTKHHVLGGLFLDIVV